MRQKEYKPLPEKHLWQLALHTGQWCRAVLCQAHRFFDALESTIEKVITTNLTYQDPELFNHDWYESADLSKYIATLIDHLNHNASISSLLDQSERIQSRIQEYKEFGTISDNYKAPTV